MPRRGVATDTNAARWQIIQAVNNWKMTRKLPISKNYVYAPKLFGMRQIQQAVWVARRRRLVPSALLEAAGYRGYKDA